MPNFQIEIGVSIRHYRTFEVDPTQLDKLKAKLAESVPGDSFGPCDGTDLLYEALGVEWPGDMGRPWNLNDFLMTNSSLITDDDDGDLSDRPDICICGADELKEEPS